MLPSIQERSEMNGGKFTGESLTTDEHLTNFLNLEKNPVLFLALSFVESQKLHGIRQQKSLKCSWKTVHPGQLQKNMHS